MNSSRFEVHAKTAGNCHPSKCTKADSRTHFALVAATKAPPPLDDIITKQIARLSDWRGCPRPHLQKNGARRHSGKSRPASNLLLIKTARRQIRAIHQTPNCATNTIPRCQSDRKLSPNHLAKTGHKEITGEKMPLSHPDSSNSRWNLADQEFLASLARLMLPAKE